MKLKGELLSAKEVTEYQKTRMCQLLNQYFQHISFCYFEKDLAEKDWVILLSDFDSGSIQGFSTQKLMRARINGTPVRAIFSGDTIIDKNFWGGTELVKKWFDLVFSLLKEDQDTKLYWFLISMGFRTYRYLPIYFYDFYPRFDRDVPLHEKAILDTFALMQYPGQYISDKGIIHFTNDVACLRSDYAEIPDHKLTDPHIKFFLEKNPFYAQGDELACLAELSGSNFKPIVRKLTDTFSKLGVSR